MHRENADVMHSIFMSSPRDFIAKASCLVLVSFSTVFAQSNFTGADLAHNTDWFTAGNWDPSGVPTSSTDVTIGPDASISFDGSGSHAVAAGLTISAGPNIYLYNGATLVNGVTVLGRSVDIEHGASWTVNGSLANNGSILVVGGLITNPVSSSLTSGTMTQDNGAITAEGYGATVTINGDYIGNDSILNFTQGAEITTNGDVKLGNASGHGLTGYLQTGANWTVNGTFSVGAVGSASLSMSGGILTTGNATIGSNNGGVSLAPGDNNDGAIWHVNGTLAVGSSTPSTVGQLEILGGSTLDAASVSVMKTGVLRITDSTYAGHVDLIGGKLERNGTVGSLTVSNGGLLNPNNFDQEYVFHPIETLHVTGNAEMGTQSFFRFDISAAAGTPGTDWDLLTVGGQLTFSATNAQPFTLLVSGYLPDFDPDQSYVWDFIQAGSVTGFDASICAIDLSSFYNSYTGTFGVVQDGNNIALSYTAAAIPEPATAGVLGGLAVFGFVLIRGSRQRQEASNF